MTHIHTKSITALLFFVTLYFLPSSAFSQTLEQRKDARLDAFRSFRQTQDASLSVRWNTERGYPDAITQFELQIPGVDQSDERAIADAFYDSYKEMLGVGDQAEELVYTRTTKLDHGQTALLHSQFYNGIKVLGSGYKMAVAGKGNRHHAIGSIYYLAGTVYPDIKIETIPEISAMEAGSSIRSYYGSSFVELKKTPSLAIYPKKTTSGVEYVLVYTTTAVLENGSEMIHVNAKDGSHVFSLTTGADVNHLPFYSDQMAKIPTQESVLSIPSTAKKFTCSSDCGLVFVINPYEDSDTTSDEYLYYLSGAVTLDGTWAVMKNQDESGATADTSSSGDFDYSYDEENPVWQFDQTNAYYHIGKSAAQLYDHADSKITVETHDNAIQVNVDEENNEDSYVELRSTYSGWLNSHLDPTVIIHEYWHLVQIFRDSTLNDAAPGIAIWEGVSDFAGVYYAELQGSSSTEVMSYHAKDKASKYRRDVDNNCHYDNYPLDCDGDGDRDNYDAGMFLAAALWNWFHGSSENHILETATLQQAMSWLPPDPEITDYHGAMAATEACETMSSCPGTLNSYFCTNGLYDCGAKRGAPIEIAGSIEFTAESLPTETELVGNYPNPFNPSTLITYHLVEPTHVSIQIFDVMGRLVTTLVDRNEKEGRFRVRWNGLNSAGIAAPSGSYIYRMITGDTDQSKVLLLIR